MTSAAQSYLVQRQTPQHVDGAEDPDDVFEDAGVHRIVAAGPSPEQREELAQLRALLDHDQLGAGDHDLTDLVFGKSQDALHDASLAGGDGAGLPAPA